MKIAKNKITKSVVSSVMIASLSAFNVHAQEVPNPVIVNIMPFQFATVKGDAQKFRAMQWMNDGTSYGLKELIVDKTVNKDTHVSLEGHSLPNDYDNAVELKLSKDSLGYLKTDYTSFRKYYDGTGGVYYPFTNMRVTTLGDDLKMDMQHFLVEVGTKTPDEPGVGLAFERHTKDGRKSRLAWTAVKAGATTRDIGPSWQDVQEVTDSVALKSNGEVAGIHVSGEQKFEFFHAQSLREEKSISSAGGLTSDTKMRRQWQEPQSDLFTTTFKGDRWFLDDKNYVSLGYRFSNMDASELENITEYKADGTPFNYSNPKSAVNASANNKYKAHTTVASFMSSLTSTLSFISKFKSEVIGRRGVSTYPHDTTANTPDGIINTTDVSNTENKIYRFGENFSLRYNGLPKTSLYSEVELEQTRNWLAEERNSIAGQSSAEAGEQLGRETRTNIQNTVFTAGARIVPTKSVNITTQVRHKLSVNDYDDIMETTYSSGSKSAFMDALKTKGDEASAKIAWKPISRVEGVVRYKLISNRYMPRVENEPETKSRGLSNIFTYDLNLQPIDPLFVTLSFSQDFSDVKTRAGSVSSTQIPSFESNSNSWLASASYVINEKLSLNSSYQYTIIDNFNDVTTSSLQPYGADNKSYDMTMGLAWNVNKSFSLEPHYSYYSYRTNQDADNGSYSAHVVWLDAKLLW